MAQNNPQKESATSFWWIRVLDLSTDLPMLEQSYQHKEPSSPH